MSEADADSPVEVQQLFHSANEAASENTQVSSEALLGPRGELLIDHRGRAYCLRITRNGKLILTA